MGSPDPLCEVEMTHVHFSSRTTPGSDITILLNLVSRILTPVFFLNYDRTNSPLNIIEKISCCVYSSATFFSHHCIHELHLQWSVNNSFLLLNNIPLLIFRLLLFIMNFCYFKQWLCKHFYTCHLVTEHGNLGTYLEWNCWWHIFSITWEGQVVSKWQHQFPDAQGKWHTGCPHPCWHLDYPIFHLFWSDELEIIYSYLNAHFIDYQWVWAFKNKFIVHLLFLWIDSRLLVHASSLSWF